MKVSVSRDLEQLLSVSIQRSSLQAYLVPRSSVRSLGDVRPGVYVLMDWRRSCCYVGEAGRGNDGVSGRLKGHLRAKNEKWWSDVVYFIDSNPDPVFANDSHRLWIEWELFRRAFRVFPVVTSVDTKTEGRVAGVLDEILDLCRVLGVPFFQTQEERDGQLDLFSNPAPPVADPPPATPPQWVSRSALAQEIGRRFNGGVGIGGLDQILAGTRKAGDKWQEILSRCGLQTTNGFLAKGAWRKARLP